LTLQDIWRVRNESKRMVFQNAQFNTVADAMALYTQPSIPPPLPLFLQLAGAVGTGKTTAAGILGVALGCGGPDGAYKDDLAGSPAVVYLSGESFANWRPSDAAIVKRQIKAAIAEARKLGAFPMVFMDELDKVSARFAQRCLSTIANTAAYATERLVIVCTSNFVRHPVITDEFSPVAEVKAAMRTKKWSDELVDRIVQPGTAVFVPFTHSEKEHLARALFQACVLSADLCLSSIRLTPAATGRLVAKMARQFRDRGGNGRSVNATAAASASSASVGVRVIKSAPAARSLKQFVYKLVSKSLVALTGKFGVSSDFLQPNDPLLMHYSATEDCFRVQVAQTARVLCSVIQGNRQRERVAPNMACPYDTEGCGVARCICCQLRYACAQGDVRTVVLILDDLPADAHLPRDRDDWSLLHVAASHVELDVIETLLKSGRFDPSARDKVLHVLPLHVLLACVQNDTRRVRNIFKRLTPRSAAEVDVADARGLTLRDYVAFAAGCLHGVRVFAGARAYARRRSRGLLSDYHRRPRLARAF
jgi:hypothetical protein